MTLNYMSGLGKQPYQHLLGCYLGLALTFHHEERDSVFSTSIFCFDEGKLFLEEMRASMQSEDTMGSSNSVEVVGFDLNREGGTLMSACSPMRRSAWVQPTSVGVSLKLASLVSIWKPSPLKTLILMLHEPRSIPQITEVDSIIKKSVLQSPNLHHKNILEKMLPQIPLFLFLVSLTISSDPSLTLHTHAWCPPCLKAKSIFSKLNHTYSQYLSFRLIEHTDKKVLLRQSQSSTQADILSFPTLLFNCSQRRFTYQNDFSFKEISYWIDAVCFGKLATCTDAINQELFHISVRPQPNVLPLVEAMQKHPHIRICEAANANYSHKQAVSILSTVDNQTVFLDYFSNNVRNYLLQSQKLAVALITPSTNSSKAKSFFSAYLGLQNFVDQNQSLKVFRYQMEEEHKRQLVFLGLCLNRNESQCVASDDRRTQVAISMKFIPKLMQFVGIDGDLQGETEHLVAFRFKYPQFETYIYHHSHGILDEKFLFWLAQILNTKKKPEIPRLCLWNSLVHRISQNSLQDVETNAFLKNKIDQFKETFEEKIVLTTSVKTFHNDVKFTLCLIGEFPRKFASNNDAKTILWFLQEKLRRGEEQERLI